MTTEPAAKTFVHRVDAGLRISFVNAEWINFASDNGYDTTAERELGRPLLSVIADEETQHVYKLLIERVRSSRETLQFGYRCDSPNLRRLMQMQMRYLAESDEIEFESRLLHTEPRPYMPLVAQNRRVTQQASQRVLSMCSWCKAVLAGRSWVEVEEAVMRLRLFATDTMPRITHGICPDCSKRLLSSEPSI